MSDDIVNRLRKGTNDGLRAWDWMREAADEITRLRADLAAVTEERDRMMEALKDLIEEDEYQTCSGEEDDGIVRAAARALIKSVTEPATGDSNA